MLKRVVKDQMKNVIWDIRKVIEQIGLTEHLVWYQMQ